MFAATDAENRTLSATNGSASGTYTYEGNNLRVKRVSGSTTTVYLFSASKLVAEYVNGALPTAQTREYIYSGGALLAKIEAGATKYYHQDHLSNRLVTDSSGNVTAQIGHFPFGESWYNASNDKLLFTTYERDAESGNDYAMARYYVNRLGRFNSPDALSGSTDPQSLNRYPYAQNNPANSVDPSGMVTVPCDVDWWCPGDGGGGGFIDDSLDCNLSGCLGGVPIDWTPIWHTAATMSDGKGGGIPHSRPRLESSSYRRRPCNGQSRLSFRAGPCAARFLCFSQWLVVRPEARRKPK